MIRSELIQKIADDNPHLYQRDVERIVNTIFEEITGAMAHFECFNKSRYEEGDHVIFVGQVEQVAHRPEATPLLFHGGRFYTEHPL